MIIEKTDFLNDDMSDLFTDLVLDVNEVDGGKYTVPDDADFYALMYEETKDIPDELLSAIAVYDMGETHSKKDVAELVAFTGPKHRGKGYFKLLFQSLKEELKDVSLRFAVYEDTAVAKTRATVKSTLKSIGAHPDHDELLMKLFLVTEKEFEVPKLSINITSLKASDADDPTFRVTTPFGECLFKIYDNTAYVYGILTYEKFQNKGFAAGMLKQLFSYLRKKDINGVTLEVSSENTAALNLYKKLGFEVVERLTYYYLD